MILTLQLFGMLIAIYFCFYGLYWLVLVLAGKEKVIKHASLYNDNPEILLVLPAYQPGPIFLKVLDAVATASHNRNIKTFVLLQHADSKYGDYARQKGFWVESKEFDHLPGNSYQHALRYITQRINSKQNLGRINPEFVMLLDKDNLIAPDFFSHIPPHVYDQFDIIQGKRLSLSTTNAVSFFDHMAERLNDTMFRYAKQNLGCMIEISGSGALIETDLFIDTIQRLDKQAPGFDKNFMVNLLDSKREVRTIFWPACTLQEEKTSAIEAHNPQRIRWFGEQYYNALYHGSQLMNSAIRHKRWAPVDYLLTLCRPPRSVQVMLVSLLALLELGIYALTNNWVLMLPVMVIAASLQSIALTIFVIRQKALLKSLRYSLRLPMLAIYNFGNAIKSIRKENQGKFIHTKHHL
jgi:cellulose synthase/poly-beta-1,6-N-acetylglucosamine synthase-like glycosyltransferase